MFDRIPNSAPATNLLGDFDDGFPGFEALTGEIDFASSPADNVPITAVLSALSQGNAETKRRRDEVELHIRTHWAALCRLVIEYNTLSVPAASGASAAVAVPEVARFTPRPVKARTLVPPKGRARH